MAPVPNETGDILYGEAPARQGPAEIHYAGLVVPDWDLVPADAEDLVRVLSDVQRLIDRATGWDQIDSSWYSEASNPDNWKGGRAPDFGEREKRWAEDTRKRFKVGVTHHSMTGLVWSVWFAPHTPAGVPTSGSSDWTRFALCLGDLFAEFFSLCVSLRPAERIYPPGLESWWADRSEDHFSALYELRQRI